MPAYGTSSWPTDFDGCTVMGKFVGLNGAPIAGTITFNPTPKVLLDYAQLVTIVPRSITVTLDVNGAFSIFIPATDDPDISPVDWTYTVSESWVGGLTFSMEAPVGAVVDITVVTPIPSSDGLPIYRGPQGLPGGVQTVQGVAFDDAGNVDLTGKALLVASNLSDLASKPTARTNLGLGTAATHVDTDFAWRANNLSDLANKPTARTNLGLGTAATHVDTDFAWRANNLSDLASKPTARTNLGLGGAAVLNASDITPLGSIIMYPVESPPDSNWMRCDGHRISRTTYAALFAIIGTIYGVGDGSTTFNLPDCRDVFILGSNGFFISTTPHNYPGSTGGSSDHSHPLSTNGQALVTAAAGQTAFKRQTVVGGWTDNAEFPVGTGSLPANAQTQGAALAGRTDVTGFSENVLPPYLRLGFIIRVL